MIRSRWMGYILTIGLIVVCFAVTRFEAAQAQTQVKTTVPTFSKDIAPIFAKNCMSCHRSGEIAPMSLQTYKEVRPWAKSIREQVAKREMPPWQADPAHGQWENDRRLSQKELDTVLAWEEMMNGFFDYTVDAKPAASGSAANSN